MQWVQAMLCTYLSRQLLLRFPFSLFPLSPLLRYIYLHAYVSAALQIQAVQAYSSVYINRRLRSVAQHAIHFLFLKQLFGSSAFLVLPASAPVHRCFGA